MAPITRDITQIFVGYRNSHRAPKHPGYRPLAEAEQELLEGGGGGGRGRTAGAVLPPEWVDSSEEARETMSQIRRKIPELQRAQQRRLLNVFQKEGQESTEVETIASSLRALLSHCELLIHQVSVKGAGSSTSTCDMEFQRNLQRSLAAELQQLSKECHEVQRSYMDEVRRRRVNMGLEPEAPDVEEGTQGALMSELDERERFAAQRSSEVAQLAASIYELHSIFKNLAILVIDQGTIMDRIDCNMEKVFQKGSEAKDQLQKAHTAQRKQNSRVLRIVLVLLIVDSLLLLFYAYKTAWKFGWTFTTIWLCFLGALVLGVYAVLARFFPSYRPHVSVACLRGLLPDGGCLQLWSDCKADCSPSAWFGGFRGRVAANVAGLAARRS